MKVIFSFIFFLSLFSNAGVIVPNEDLGQVRITVPSLASTDLQQLVTHTIWAESGKSSIRMKSGDIYDVAAGDICIVVANSNLPKVTKCGFKVLPDTLTEIDLALLALEWQEDAVAVGLGNVPQLNVKFLDEKAQPLFSTGLNPYLKTRAYVLPEMPIEAAFAAPDILIDQTFKIVLKTGELNTFNVTPEDRRATIVFTPGDAPLYQKIKFGYSSLTFRNIKKLKVPDLLKDAHHSLLTFNPRAQKGYVDSFDFEGVATTTHVFPLSEDERLVHRFDFVVNNVVRHLEPKAGETIALKVENFDISDFPDKGPGSFKVMQLDPFSVGDFSVEKELKQPVTSRRDHDSVFRPTTRSIELPKGWKYRFDFFLKDNFGKVSLEDEVEVDLL